MTEKNTDRYMQEEYEKIFNKEYHTEGNNNLFSNKIPDGWDIFKDNKILFIIENKKDVKDKNKAKKQLIEYYKLLSIEIKGTYEIYLIFGYGNTIKTFNYEIYKIINEDKKKKIVNINKRLNDIKNKMGLKIDFDEKEIHNFNQYLYENGIILNKNQKTLFVSSILLSLKVDNNFIKNYDINKPGFLLADKIIELINEGYNDPIFTSQFKFIQKSLKNKYLYDLINKIYIDVKKYGKDILNKFYNEFCKWDKNDDSKNGVVLTPHDIIEIMIKELNINKDDIVLDFCTGTGSFLLEAGKKSKNLIGCEYNEERYALCKCNFILNDLDYTQLYYNNCFNQLFIKVNKSIINPPFKCNSPDEEVEENITNWKKYNFEQKFLLYQVQNLKIGGIGACIIPRSNFNNTIKKTNEFKKELLRHIRIKKIINCNNKIFKPVANTECTIIIYERIQTTNNNISENVEIIDYSNDGYKIQDNMRIKYKEPEIKTQIRNLNYNDDWNFIKNINKELKYEKIYYIQYYKQLIYDLQNRIKMLENNEIEINELKNINEFCEDPNFNFNIKEIKQLKISDYFEIIKPIKIFQISKTEDGDIPLISSSYINNGISKYINNYSYNGECLTIARNGSVGSCFYHNEKIAITSDIIIMKAKENNNINLKLWGLIINYYLPKKYSYTNKLSKDKLLNEIIDIPIYDNNDIEQLIINLNTYNNYKEPILNIKIKEYQKLKIDDYFEIAKPLKTFTINKSINGNIPLITRSSVNNGISKYINDYSFDGEYITIAPSGSTGTCFYHNGKFAVDGPIKTFKPKENNKINLKVWALMINYYLTKKYSYTNGLSIDKILNEIINIPIFEE